MTTKDDDILQAAFRVFQRYGVKRSSMGDLAKEAGVSRQTVYNAFKNKDEILRAMIRQYSQKAVAELDAALPEMDSLGAQLDLVFDKIALTPYDMIAASPNAEDIIEGFDRVSQEELDVAHESYRVVIERILTPHAEALARAGQTPRDRIRAPRPVLPD